MWPLPDSAVSFLFIATSPFPSLFPVRALLSPASWPLHTLSPPPCPIFSRCGWKKSPLLFPQRLDVLLTEPLPRLPCLRTHSRSNVCINHLAQALRWGSRGDAVPDPWSSPSGERSGQKLTGPSPEPGVNTRLLRSMNSAFGVLLDFMKRT